MTGNQVQHARARNFRASIGLPILAVAACAWCISIFVFHSASLQTKGQVATLIPIITMSHMFSSLDPRMISSFVLMWEVGMTAMMFPSLVPVVSVYQKIMTSSKEPMRSRAAKSSLFVGGYLLLYGLQGLLVFGLVYILFHFGSFFNLSSFFLVTGVAAVLFGTGFWQLTPLKERCLAKCVSPMGFFMTHSREGNIGAIRMGLENGFYCAGCCWMYSLVMVVVAAMSLLSMVLLTGLIIVEKAFLGRTVWFKWLSAGVFFALAGIVAIFPSVLF